MSRLLMIALLLLCVVPVFAEELVLKDGTKIVGKMTAIVGDKIEVETAYGKMQVNRADIVSINFPENTPESASASKSPKKELPAVDESLNGTQYLNRTGNFTLSVPTEWKINPSLRLSGDVMAGLSSRDDLRYLLVTQEEYSGSLDSYKGLIEIQAKQNLDDYEKLSENKVVIDGRSSLLLTYRGISRAANNLPIQFLVAVIPFGKGYTRITTWCVEPLFNETQGLFEKIIQSYHQTESPAPVTSSKP